MPETIPWWRRRGLARALCATAWVVTIGVWAALIVLALVPAYVLDYRFSGDTVGYVVVGALVGNGIAVGVDLLTARARGIDANTVPLRMFGAAPFGIGIGFVVGGALFAVGLLSRDGLPDRDGSSFLVVGAVLLLTGVLLFFFAARAVFADQPKARRRRGYVWFGSLIVAALVVVGFLHFAAPSARTQAAPSVAVGIVDDRDVALVVFRSDTFPRPDSTLFASDGRSVHAALIDLDAGAVLWDVPLTGDAELRFDAAPVAVDGGRVTVSTTDGLVVLDASDGTILSTDDSAPATPVTDPGSSFDPVEWPTASTTVRMPDGEEVAPDWATGSRAEVLLDGDTGEPVGADAGFLVAQSASDDGGFLLEVADLAELERRGAASSTNETPLAEDDGRGHVVLLGENDAHQAVVMIASAAGMRSVVLGDGGRPGR